MSKKQDDFVYIFHINDAIEKITTYVAAHNFEDFSNNEWDQAAITRYFEIIGEASNRLSPEFKQQHPEIEWRDMNDFRNFLIHDYMDIDLKIVWSTMTKDIPPLNEKINSLLKAKKTLV